MSKHTSINQKQAGVFFWAITNEAGGFQIHSTAPKSNVLYNLLSTGFYMSTHTAMTKTCMLKMSNSTYE